jgi:hypothetical protein
MNTFSLVIALIPLLVLALVWANPIGALRIVAGLKRSHRQYLINRYGQIHAETVFAQYRKVATQKGYDQDITEQIINEVREETVKRFGTKYANEVMGPPSFIEQNF